jgi:hypothetical protein
MCAVVFEKAIAALEQELEAEEGAERELAARR